MPCARGSKAEEKQEERYYAPAVAWAVAYNVTKGVSDTRFAPHLPCTRAQIVTFLYRCMR